MEYSVALVIVGLAILGMAWMPELSNRLRISYAFIYLVAGALLYLAVPTLPVAAPFKREEFNVRFTELVVLIALMSSGLRIDQPFSLRRWAVPLRLVSAGMLACIALAAFAAWYWIGMDAASAVVLASALAPTDPVLASDVQVGPPQEKEQDEVKFSLTAEGGMNDGTAFPFVWLGILLATQPSGDSEFWLKWIGFNVIYKLGIGLVAGYLLGKLLAYLIFEVPAKLRVLKIEDGFVAFSMTLLVYGVTELLMGYGFVAVFVCAITLRNHEMDHSYHKTLHSFSDQIERMLVAITLLIFGGTLVTGIMENLTWKLALYGLVFLFVIRPLTTWPFTVRKGALLQERLMISFFGIRGVGSIYYTSFALAHAEFKWAKELWSTVAFIIVVSIIVHGLSANVAIRKLGEVRRRSKRNS